MKKFIKLTALAVVVCTMLMALVGCGAKEETGIDLSKYPTDINEWTVADMKDYLVTAGLIDEEKEGFIFMEISQGEVEAMGIDGGFLYVDGNAASIMDTVFFYDLSKEGNADLVATAASEQACFIGEQKVSDLDGVIGGFLFSYGQSIDEEHIAAFTQAIKDLEAGLGTTAALLK